MSSKHSFPRCPNIIRGMTITRLNQVCLPDINYIRIRAGFVYVAVTLHAYSRKVIGYAVSGSLYTCLGLEVLRIAIARRQTGPGVVQHSDQVLQYASGEYVDELKKHGFLTSMPRTGNPYENAATESFFKTLKHEEVSLCQYETYQDVVAKLPTSLRTSIITRGFSQLGYRPPDEFEEVLLNRENSERHC